MSSDPAPPRPSGPLRTVWAALIGAAAGALAVAGYVSLAGSGAPTATAEPQPVLATNPHPVSAQGIADMTDKLVQRLTTQPDDADGWAMLARSYAVSGRHNEAVDPFAKALALRPDDPTLLADYADTLAMTRQRSLEGEPSRLVERALEIDANHVKALWLAGTAAFDRRDYARAIELWERLRQVSPPDSPFVPQVQAGIDEARQLAAAQVPSGIRSFAPRTTDPLPETGKAVGTK